MTPASARAPALVALLVVLALAGCGGPSPTEVRGDLLDLVPATAVERGIALWEGGLEDGFGSARPAGALTDVLGVAPEAVEAVAETGGSPFTALRVSTGEDEVVEAGRTAGYDVAEVGDWTVLRRPAGSTGSLDAAVPAAAVRGRSLLIGAPEDVAAVVDGAPAAGGERWVAVLNGEAGEGALLVGPPADVLEAAAEEEGGAAAVLDRVGTRGALPAWEGWGLVHREGGDGALLLVLPPERADADVAEALALRAATGPVLGSGRRARDVLEGGAPRFVPETGAVRLPVRWQVDPATLRRDAERGAFAFLLPAP